MDNVNRKIKNPDCHSKFNKMGLPGRKLLPLLAHKKKAKSISKEVKERSIRKLKELS